MKAPECYLLPVRPPLATLLLCSACSLTGPFDGYTDEIGGSSTERCSGPDVVRCFGFDDAAAIAPHLEPNQEGDLVGHFDPAVRAAGSGSLRFDVPASSDIRDLVGSFSINFSSDELEPGSMYPARIGEGEEIYVQWRQRFEAAVIEADGGEGWVHAVVGKGDRFAEKAAAVEAPLLNIANRYYSGVPQFALASGIPIQPDAPSGGVFLQNAVGCQSYDVSEPPCIFFHADEWMTFQVGIEVGHWNEEDSRVRVWLAREGASQVLVLDILVTLLTQNNDPDEKIGKVWFLLDDPNRPAGIQNPAASSWVDDLVISRRQIADP